MSKPQARKLVPKRKPVAAIEPAFDEWLKRGLHEIYDGIASEPVPEELLRLIQEDEGK